VQNLPVSNADVSVITINRNYFMLENLKKFSLENLMDKDDL